MSFEEAWQRGTDAARKAMADTKPPELKTPDSRATGRGDREEEPIRYCTEPDCWLTCAPEYEQCWVHRPKPVINLVIEPSEVRPFRPRAIRKARAR